MRTTVGDVMTTDVVSVDEETGYQEIARRLVESGVGAVPVTGPGGRVVGLVSEHDLLHKQEYSGDEDDTRGYRPPVRARLRERLSPGGARGEGPRGKAEATTAAGLMSGPAVCVAASASVTEAARIMEAHGVKRLPVVDDDQMLRGIVGPADLLRVFLRGDAEISGAVREEIAFLKSTAKEVKVNATVKDGVVTLSGSVRDRSTAHALRRQASRLEGVVSVVDDLRWHVDDLLYPDLR